MKNNSANLANNKLSTSYQTQVTGDKGKSDWVVYSQEKEELTRFPSHLSDDEVRKIIKFAKKYELEAFNNGIEFQKRSVPKTLSSLRNVVTHLKRENQRLLEENSRLGDTLDRVTKGENV